MLKNLKQIEGCALEALDGEIGEVKDVYFDDHSWHVRYLVVKTGTWLKQRRVLISPVVLEGFNWDEKSLPVNLTKEQVRNSPGIDTDQPVSRQREEELRLYYGWAPYWGAGIGEGIVPGLASPVPPLPPGNTMDPRYTDGNQPMQRSGDPNLRSANDTRKYAIAARDGDIGHLEDFLIDERDWHVHYLIVDTKNWLPGKKVVLAPDWISKVSWTSHNVQVDLTRETIAASPAYDPAAPWNTTYGSVLHDYYGRPRYSDRESEIGSAARAAKSRS